MKKESSIGIAAGAHLIGNGFMKYMLDNNKAGKFLGETIATTSFGKKTPSSAKFMSFLSPVAPELEGLISEGGGALRSGKNLFRYAKVLGSKSKDELLDWQMSPKAKRQNANIINRIGSGKKIGAGDLIAQSKLFQVFKSGDAKKRSQIIGDVASIGSKYGLTKSVIPSFLNESRKLSKSGYVPTKPKLLPKLISVAAIGATSLFDPITAGFAAIKRGATSHTLGKIPGVKKVQNFVTNTLIDNPIKSSYRAGVEGKKIFRGKYKDIAQDFIFSPTSTQLNNIAHDFGSLVRKHTNG